MFNYQILNNFKIFKIFNNNYGKHSNNYILISSLIIISNIISISISAKVTGFFILKFSNT